MAKKYNLQPIIFTLQFNMLIKKDKSEILDYLSDASNYQGNCEAVYFPECSEDVSIILQNAHNNKLNVTVAGSGTGLTGGRVPDDGIVVATDKLNKIIEINEKEKFAIIQPGVVLREFHQQIEKYNLFYPPDPTEQDCFIGGTIATNASGAKTFKYGSTREYVEELTVVLSSGDLLEIKRGEFVAENFSLTIRLKDNSEININLPQVDLPLTKNTAGYLCKPNLDAVDLFIGSEGTLGVIVEAKLKLLSKPKQILSGIVFFDSENDALGFVNSVRLLSIDSRKENEKNNLDALGLEFFDKNSLNFLKSDYPQIPEECNCAIWFEQDLSTENEDHILELWVEQIESYNGNPETIWFAFDDNEREKFKDFRHAVSWKVSEFIIQKGITKVGTDTAVPNEKFEEYFNYSKNLIESENIDYIVYGHIANSHLHFNMLPKNNSQFLKAKNIYKKLCIKAVELGGTISAEHGIGKIKREYFKEMFDETILKQMIKIKKTFDPNLILGIGNIFEKESLYK